MEDPSRSASSASSLSHLAAPPNEAENGGNKSDNREESCEGDERDDDGGTLGPFSTRCYFL